MSSKCRSLIARCNVREKRQKLCSTMVFLKLAITELLLGICIDASSPADLMAVGCGHRHSRATGANQTSMFPRARCWTALRP